MSQQNSGRSLNKKRSLRSSRDQSELRRKSHQSQHLQYDDDAQSYHSMTMSQRINYNNAKMMEDAGMLPNIDEPLGGSKFGSRVQSASKRSAASLKNSTFKDNKGPIKAFVPVQGSASEDQFVDIDDKNIQGIQIVDRLSGTQKSGTSQQPKTLEPIQRSSQRSSQVRRSSHMSGEKRQHRNGRQLSNGSARKLAKSETEFDKDGINEDQKADRRSQHRISGGSTLQKIPPPTTGGERMSSVKATSEDGPVINLDLHQVAIDRENLQSGASLHDQEAIVLQKDGKNKSPLNTISIATKTVPSVLSDRKTPSHIGHSQSDKTPTKKTKPKRVNQFKANKMSHEEIINFLFDLSAASVGLNRKMEPKDLDSTQGLDSFLKAIIKINEENVQKKDQKLIDSLHLSTGTRTNFCLEVINFIIKQQAKETIFIDAVEFFQESLEHMLQVESQNKQNRQQVEELTQAKTELTMMRFDLQNKLRETSNALLKTRQKEYEQSLSYAETKQHLQAKQAECESLHFRLKHLGFGVTDSGEQVQPAAQQSIDQKTDSAAIPRVSSGELEGTAIKIAEGGIEEQNSITAADVNIINSGSNADLQASKQSDRPLSASQEATKKIDSSVDDIRKGLEDKVEEFRNFQAKNLDGPDETRQMQRLQDLLNQIQIDNKNLIDENAALKTRLDSKDRRVTHLENKVTNILIENEETCIKLKSEIVLMRNQIDSNGVTTTKQLLQMRTRVEGENEKSNGQTIAELKSSSEKLMRENDLQKQRIDQLSLDYSNLHTEFERYRVEKQAQETQRDVYVTEVEQKLGSLSKNHVTVKNSSSEQIKSLENSLEQKKKENQILYLRLRYMRQTVDVLLRQKHFLSDTLQKSKLELEMKMNQLESGMLSQNKNKSYLVSVEKAIKQSRNVAEISKSALQNILQIVKFFKVEKIHSLVFQTEEPTDNKDVISESSKERGLLSAARVSKPFSEDQASHDSQGPDATKYHLETITGMLNELKSALDLPVNFKPRITEQASQSRTQSRGGAATKITKHEEYYLDHCSTELVSALLKIIVESLIRSSSIDSVEQIPFSISRLLYLASNRSDQPVEREIFETFCLESNSMMIDEHKHNVDKLETFEKIRGLIPKFVDPENATSRAGQMIKISDVEQQSTDRVSVTDQEEAKSAGIRGHKPLTMMQQSALMLRRNQESEKRGKDVQTIPIMQIDQNSIIKTGQSNHEPESSVNKTTKSQNISKKVMKNDLDLLALQTEEQKLQNKQIQQGLAEKIVKLEETIDFIKEDHEEKLSQAEFAYRQELEQIRLGTMQREKQLLNQIAQISDRNANLEISHDQKASQMNNNQNTTAAKTSNNLLRGSSSQSMSHMRGGDNLRQAASMHSALQAIDDEAKENMQVLERKFENYKSNVKEFLRIRESTNGTISLVFEASQANFSMINEQILQFYLSRIFRLPKEKFKFLQTYYIQDEKKISDFKNVESQRVLLHKPEQPVEMLKIVVEVIEDHKFIRQDLLDLKTSIRDGSSLLYDLLPSYVCINMGHSGLATANSLSTSHLISKQGRQIDGIDFVANLMRSTLNPYCFIVVLLNLDSGEEYCLELTEHDIQQLTEGDRGLLEDSEPIDLQNLIIDNLELIERDGVKFLTCAHKVFFNQLWHGIMASKVSQTSQHIQPSKLQQQHDLRVQNDTMSPQNKIPFSHTTVRDQAVLEGKPFNKLNAAGHFKQLLQKNASCQTDYEGSLLYDSMVPVFKGHNQLNEEVRIDMEVLQSLNENLVTMIFKDSKSDNNAKFCVFNRSPNSNMTSMANTENTEDGQANTDLSNAKDAFTFNGQGAGNQLRSQYIIHSEVINVGKEHLVMVCVERIQNDGFMIKLHDLKMITSDEFYLVRKSNGHLTRFNLSQNLQLQYQEDFRNLIFDLAFAQQTQSQDLMLQNLSYASDKLQALGKSPQLVTSELFKAQGGNKNDNTIVRRLNDFKSEAVARVTSNQQELMKNTEWRSLQEKGLLLYREVKCVRTNFESLATKKVTTSEEQMMQESLISLYLKNDMVNIEVFLYQDEQKMSINTNVSALELFGRDPNDILFAERVTLLDTMLEKLFVLQQDNRFHMKVENQAESIHVIKEKYQDKLNALEEFNSKSTSALKRKYNQDQAFEDKIREIQMDKHSFVKNGRARQFQRYVTLRNLQWSINIYIMIKQKKNFNKQATKRLTTVGKTQQQIEQQKIENYLEENGDFDQVYIETISPTSDNTLFLLLDRKALARVLTRDVTCDWRHLIQTYQRDLVDYIFRNINIDVNSKKIDIYNQKDISDMLVNQCRAMNGGQLLLKSDNVIVDGFDAESNDLMQKTLVLNEEVDFTEISYDIKLYKISRKSPFGDGKLAVGAETLSYHIEVFNINQPDVIYKHRIPVQQTSKSNVHDPTTFVVDVFNLIDNALVDELAAKIEAQNDSQLNNTQSGTNNSRAKSNASNKKGKSAQPQKGEDKKQNSGKQLTKAEKEKEAEQEAKEQEARDKKAKLEEEKSEMEKVMKEHSTKYQLLFKKYIDNQLILVIQESKFPASISFTIVEPSSRMIYKTCYEPTTEIVSPSSFSVVDQGSFETFMTVVYDNVVTQSIISEATCQKIKVSGDWHNSHQKDIGLLANHEITEKLQIQIKKHLGKLHIRLKNPQLEDEPSRPATELTENQDENGSALMISSQIQESKNGGVDLVIQQTRGVYFITKILNLDDIDLNEAVTNSFIFMVKVSIECFEVQVLDLRSQTCVFHFRYTHTNPVEQDVHVTPITQVNPFTKLQNIKLHVLDAIKNLNSEHMQELVESNHIRIRQNKTLTKAGLDVEDTDTRITTFESVLFKVQECPAHQQRFYQRRLEQVKTVTLHRKIYYDETMEKLIIITANIKYIQGLQRLDNPMLLNEEIHEVDFKILEPEHNTLTTLTVPLSQCFNERQLVALNKRDMLRLKHLVRIVLEERSDIRRKEMDQDESNQAYTLSIMPQPEDQFIEEAPLQDEGENGRTMDHMHHNTLQDDQQMFRQPGNDSEQQLIADMGDLDLVDPMDDMIGDMGDDINAANMSHPSSARQTMDQREPTDQDDFNDNPPIVDQTQLAEAQLMAQNQSNGQVIPGSNQPRAQSNSVIIEDVSQEDRHDEMDSDRTPGASVNNLVNQSRSQDAVTNNNDERLQQASHMSQQQLSQRQDMTVHSSQMQGASQSQKSQSANQL